MTDTLADICAAKRKHIAQQKKNISENELLASIKYVSPTRGFIGALENKIAKKQTALIAEIKKASPSKGVIRAGFNPAALAKAYEKGGATCLSVLTDTPYFHGQDGDLKQARTSTKLPALRKDFMLEPYQIVESRVLGADCILLIMAALADAQAKELYTAAAALGMDVLVEVHDRAELDRALALSPRMIGVNNRNLKTLAVDLATAESLANHIPAHILRVCESGIFTPGDMARMNRAGFNCFLVGESLMREDDVTHATQTLLGIDHG